MKSTFTVHNRQYEVAIEKAAKEEGDKFNPYRATVSGQPAGAVSGTCQITDAALEEASKKASGGASADELLARACGKSLASELVIRKLKPDFSFVVDHRWVS